LRRASAVNLALVLLDRSEVGFMSSSPRENYCFLPGSGQMPTGSFPNYVIAGFTMEERLKEPPVSLTLDLLYSDLFCSVF
jgi:hypothetical protein